MKLNERNTDFVRLLSFTITTKHSHTHVTIILSLNYLGPLFNLERKSNLYPLIQLFFAGCLLAKSTPRRCDVIRTSTRKQVVSILEKFIIVLKWFAYYPLSLLAIRDSWNRDRIHLTFAGHQIVRSHWILCVCVCVCHNMTKAIKGTARILCLSAVVSVIGRCTRAELTSLGRTA